MRSCIRVSSTKEEIKIMVNAAAEYDEVLEEFRIKLPRIKKYYEKENLPIHIVGKALKENEQTAIRSILKQELDEKITFGDTSEVLGLHAIKRTFESSVETSETKFIRGNLRSGQREEFSGSIAILGDLNYGAEVIAGENIIVTGKIRGLAHAGANGNKKAIIAANSIEATQVRISNIVKEIPDNDFKLPFIYLDGENIEIG
ncbi:MAG: septum site-determining protein MinC [Clostridia bacterium]|nr:hypothetical protein [Clostridia bacterium]